MVKKRLSNKKILLYDKYTRNLPVFVVSAIFLGVFLLPLLINDLQRVSCNDLGGSSRNACFDGEAVALAYFSPVLFILMVTVFISGAKTFSARIELGKDFNKVKKIAQRKSVKVKKEKEYIDDSI